MDQKELKRMNRKELLELLLEQTLRVEELEKEVAALQQVIQDRKIRIESAGSIAEAALRLNDIFAVAQRAADDYLENVKRQAEKE